MVWLGQIKASLCPSLEKWWNEQHFSHDCVGAPAHSREKNQKTADRAAPVPLPGDSCQRPARPGRVNDLQWTLRNRPTLMPLIRFRPRCHDAEATCDGADQPRAAGVMRSTRIGKRNTKEEPRTSWSSVEWHHPSSSAAWLVLDRCQLCSDCKKKGRAPTGVELSASTQVSLYAAKKLSRKKTPSNSLVPLPVGGDEESRK